MSYQDPKRGGQGRGQGQGQGQGRGQGRGQGYGRGVGGGGPSSNRPGPSGSSHMGQPKPQGRGQGQKDELPLGSKTGPNLSTGPGHALRSSSTGNFPPTPFEMQQAPNEQEREWYFHGLGGGQLVARTNSIEQPWSLPTFLYDSAHPNPLPGVPTQQRITPKRYCAVGVHAQSDRPLIRALRPTLPRIQEELDSSGIDWTWFTGIRIGLVKEDAYFDWVNYDQNKDFPLVILVHVTPGSTNFDFGSRVAWAIKGILVRRGLPNIHVEMREGEISEHSMPRELGSVVRRQAFVEPSKNNATITKAVLPLLPILGWTVERAEGMARSRTRAGTVGLYIRLRFGDGGSKPLAITCYHVLMPDWKTTDKRITIKNAEPQVPVSMADDQTYRKVIIRLRVARDAVDEEINQLRTSTSNPTEQQQATMNAKLDSRQYANKLLDIVKTVNDDETGNTKNPEKAFRKGTGLKKRVIGEIWATPEYVVTASGDFKGFWNDYVLLSLEDRLMEGAANEFYLEWELFVSLHSSGENPLGSVAQVVLMPPLPLSISSTPPQAEARKHVENQFFMKIQNATSRVGRVTDQHSQGPGAVRVVKSGMHGVTLGVTNGIEACIRDKKAGEPGRPTTSSGSKANNAAHSWEIMVIPFPKTEGARFSQPGDSGASVVDIEGNVVGILVAGAPSGAAPEKAWRGYKDPEILNPLAREPKGFEKGKGPAEAQLKPQGPESVAEPYAPDIWVSFVTPMEFILEDIKRVTGAQSVDILK